MDYGNTLIIVGAIIIISFQALSYMNITTVSQEEMQEIEENVVTDLDGKCLSKDKLLNNYSLNYFQEKQVLGILSGEKKLIGKTSCGYTLNPAKQLQLQLPS